MGVESNLAKFIISSYNKAKPYKKVLTLGRQTLMMSEGELKALLKEFNVAQGDILSSETDYADILFRQLGSESVSSIDFSAYEGANILHDMNEAIPDNLKENFDLVFDGGTLEHIFNFPVALRNCIEMLKVGGRIIICTPANNMCGHGFYQFSPELFYRVFSGENGFKIIRLLAVDAETGDWFSVTDPELVKSRVELVNFHPVYLYIEAEKISTGSLFKKTPQQSDYVTSWKDNDTLIGKLKSAPPKSTAVRLALKKAFPFFYDVAKLLLKKTNNLRDRRFYSSTDASKQPEPYKPRVGETGPNH